MELQDFLAAGAPTSTASRVLAPLRRFLVRLLMPYIVVVLHENEVRKVQVEELERRLRIVEIEFQRLSANVTDTDTRLQDSVSAFEGTVFDLRALRMDHMALCSRLEVLRIGQPWGD